ncbi:MAG: MFS transporter, partial [Boseongicola sp.]|nr:MFS transporter [Boseongicola sp.]
MSPARAIIFVFFLHAATFGGVFARLPDIQSRLGMDDATLGLGLTLGALGGMFALFVSARMIARFGTKLTLLIGVPAMAVLSALTGVVGSVPAIFAVFLVNGTVFSFTNIAMNIEADRIESHSGRKVMNRAHALWSAGMLLASLVGVAARALPVSTALHLGLIAPLIIAGVLVALIPIEPAPRAEDDRSERKGFAWPDGKTLILMLFALSAGIGQSGTQNWSVIFMDQNFGAPDWLDTLALPAYLGCLMISRLLSDGWIERFGQTRVIYAQSGAALFGLLLVIVSPGLWSALIGFALIGLGTAILFPMTITAAARIPDRPAADSVAAMVLATSIVMMIAHAFRGWVS